VSYSFYPMLVKAPSASHICHSAAEVLTRFFISPTVPVDSENPQYLLVKTKQ